MKQLLACTLLISSIAFTASCSSTSEEDFNRPVTLPDEPKEKPYFVSKNTILKRLATPQSAVKLTFNYNGSIIVGSRHNQVQATAISNAINTPSLADQQFTFTIQGSHINYNHKEQLFNLLSYSRVSARNFQVLSTNTGGSSTVVENTIKNRDKENKTIVIMRRL